MMLLALFVLLAAAPDAKADAPERTAWMQCLTNYAQPEIAGTKTAATIALEAMAVCAPERAAYRARLQREGKDARDLGTVLSVDDHAAARMVIAFVNRNR